MWWLTEATTIMTPGSVATTETAPSTAKTGWTPPERMPVSIKAVVASIGSARETVVASVPTTRFRDLLGVRAKSASPWNRLILWRRARWKRFSLAGGLSVSGLIVRLCSATRVIFRGVRRAGG